MDNMTLLSFYEMLENHDWYYYFSDDSSVDRKGASNERLILSIANQSPAHMELYKDFNDFMFSGEPWNNSKKPKPARPT